DYSGPAGPMRRTDSSSLLEMWRFALEHFVAVTATSASIPSVMISMAPLDGAKTPLPSAGEYSYSDMSIRDVRDGRIAAITIDKVKLSTSITAPGQGPQPFNGEVEKIAAYDIDAGATLALFDPAKAKDD